MKFKGIVIGILTAILALNAVMAVVLITETKRQTKIAITQLNLARWKDRYEIDAFGDDKTLWLHAINETDDLLDKLEQNK